MDVNMQPTEEEGYIMIKPMWEKVLNIKKNVAGIRVVALF